MAKLQFSEGGLGCQTENTQSAKKWLNFFLAKTENTQSAKKWVNCNFRGGGVGGGLGCQTENTQSARKWLNFNFPGGGCRVPNLKILKVPRNSLISIFFGGGQHTLPSQSQNSKCQDLPKFQFLGGGGWLCSESGALSEF